MNNAPGNVIDKAVCDEIIKLSENNSEFIKQLERAKSSLKSNTNEQQSQIEKLKKAISDKDIEISNLIKTLSQSANNAVHEYIIKEIDKLHEEKGNLEKQLSSLNGLTKQYELSETEFDLVKDILTHFANSYDTMSVDEKRAALRVFINKIEWDGDNAHVYLFGANEDSIEPLSRDCKRGFNGVKKQP